MAFDRPLEADRVDNLGLLSSFVRAPFVAPIIWAIGGLLPEEKENVTSLTSKPQFQDDLSRGSGNETTIGPNTEIQPQHTTDILIETRNQMTSGGSSSASLRRTTAKVEGLSTFKHHHNQVIDEPDENIQHSSSSLYTKKNRKTSWSDESGQDLVQYCNKIIFILVSHTMSPASTSNVTCKWEHFGLHSIPFYKPSSNQGQTEGDPMAPQKKPMKSAMRKGSRRHNPSQCIPSMPPSVKGCTASAGGGYISPQWGWYISTTPPTPEYYTAGSQRHPVLSHHNMMNTNNANAHLANQVVTPNHNGNHYGTIGKDERVPSTNTSTTTTVDESSPKPLFTKGPLKYSSGWPTVPL